MFGDILKSWRTSLGGWGAYGPNEAAGLTEDMTAPTGASGGFVWAPDTGRGPRALLSLRKEESEAAQACWTP